MLETNLKLIYTIAKNIVIINKTNPLARNRDEIVGIVGIHDTHVSIVRMTGMGIAERIVQGDLVNEVERTPIRVGIIIVRDLDPVSNAVGQADDVDGFVRYRLVVAHGSAVGPLFNALRSVFIREVNLDGGLKAFLRGIVGIDGPVDGVHAAGVLIILSDLVLVGVGRQIGDLADYHKIEAFACPKPEGIVAISIISILIDIPEDRALVRAGVEKRPAVSN